MLYRRCFDPKKSSNSQLRSFFFFFFFFFFLGGGWVQYDKIGWGHFDKYSFFLSKSRISSEIWSQFVFLVDMILLFEGKLQGFFWYIVTLQFFLAKLSKVIIFLQPPILNPSCTKLAPRATHWLRAPKVDSRIRKSTSIDPKSTPTGQNRIPEAPVHTSR